MLQAPEVSVVVAAYNHEKYIRTLLESILNQTFKDFELIVIDDGSTDSTADIIEDVAKQYPEKIRFVRQQNRGFARAINTAFKMCKGKYIAPVGSDDIWLPNKLQEQIEKFNEDPEFSLVYADINVMNEDGKILYRFNRFVKPYWGQITDSLLVANFISGIVPMYKKDLFEKYGYWDEKYAIACDYEFSLRVSPYIKVGYISKVLALYRTHKHNSSTLSVEKTIFENLSVLEIFLASHPKLIKKTTVLRAYSNLYLRFTKAYIVKRDWKNTIKNGITTCYYHLLLLQAYTAFIFVLPGRSYCNFKRIIKKRFVG
ncbi:MAG: glycosyltransferase [Sedimentisphaerales bacterium]